MYFEYLCDTPGFIYPKDIDIKQHYKLVIIPWFIIYCSTGSWLHSFWAFNIAETLDVLKDET